MFARLRRCLAKRRKRMSLLSEIKGLRADIKPLRKEVADLQLALNIDRTERAALSAKIDKLQTTLEEALKDDPVVGVVVDLGNPTEQR